MKYKYLIAGESEGRMVAVKKKFGRLILAFCPFLMKGLSIIGTAAMFLVGGGIIVHGVGFLHHYVEGILATQYYAAIISQLLNFAIGMASGATLLALLNCCKALTNKFV